MDMSPFCRKHRFHILFIDVGRETLSKNAKYCFYSSIYFYQI